VKLASLTRWAIRKQSDGTVVFKPWFWVLQLLAAVGLLGGVLSTLQYFGVDPLADWRARRASGALVEQEQAKCAFSDQSVLAVLTPEPTIETVEGAAFSALFCSSQYAVVPGDSVIYVARIINIGDSDLHDVRLAVNLGEDVAYIGGSTSVQYYPPFPIKKVADSWITNTHNFGFLAPGDSVVLYFEVKVKNDVPTGDTVESWAWFKTNELPEWELRSISLPVPPFSKVDAHRDKLRTCINQCLRWNISFYSRLGT
jgi:hypothetical protein